MVSASGSIQLDYQVESIRVGQRHRRDLGELDGLIASIRSMGMLQPITISPDGLLICGARRLAAAKQLGLRQISVWVRSGISTPLQRLLAEQHDNTIRKPFTASEAADLYKELKVLLAEDASRRQHATQFGGETVGVCGAADSAAPQDRTTRAQAARLVSGRKSYTRYEQVLELKRATKDRHLAVPVRKAALEALVSIDTHGTVNGAYQKFKTTRAAHAKSVEDPALLEARKRRRRLRAFLLEMNDLSDWPTGHDPDEIGPALDDEQWATLQTLAATAAEFVTAAQHARQT